MSTPSEEQIPWLQTSSHNDSSDRRQSLYNSLPSELLLAIGLYTNGLTLTALCQVSRRFKSIFSTLGETMWSEDLKANFRYFPPYFDGEDLTELYLALRRDQSSRKLRQDRRVFDSTGEEDAVQDDDSLFCTSCSTRHSREKFSEEQILHPTTSDGRKCKDSETGGVQTCNHLIMPFFALQELRAPSLDRHAERYREQNSRIASVYTVAKRTLSPSASTALREYFMPDATVTSNTATASTSNAYTNSASRSSHSPDHNHERERTCPISYGLHFTPNSRRRDFIHTTDGLTLYPPTISDKIRYSEPWSYQLVSSYLLIRRAPGHQFHRHLKVSEAIEAIKGLKGGWVCPHIPMDSEAIMECLFPAKGVTRGDVVHDGEVVRSLADGNLQNSNVIWMLMPAISWHPRYSEWRATKVKKCRSQDCDTKFRVTTDVVEGRREVHLVVQRDVGKLEDANDAKWAAQRVLPMGLLPSS